MKRVLALVMIALLAVTASAGVGASPMAPDSGSSAGSTDATIAVAANGTTQNEINVTRTRIDAPGSVRHNNTKLSLDLGTAIAVDDTTLESEFQQRVDHRRLLTADTDDQLVNRFVTRIDAKLDNLRSREQQAAVAYANGDISGREFSRRLVVISHQANQLDGQLEALREEADRRESSLRGLQFRIQSFTGTAHDALERGVRGSKTSTVSVTASGNGYVLGLLDRSAETYYRQAFRFDRRNPDGDQTIRTADQAFDRIRTLYPETTTESVFFPSLDSARAAGIYEGRIDYPEGTATLYLDAATASVFYEVRQLELDAMPSEELQNETVGDIQIVVEQTFDNGPTRVKTYDAVTGEPIGARIAVNGRDVGGTGVTGDRWFIAPPGEYELTISHDGAEFTVTVGSQ